MSHRFGGLTLRNVTFQLHWLLGVTAGIVLALVGVTGAMLSFEDEALAALNPGIITVEPRGVALSPEALVSRIAEQRPDDTVQSLARYADPGRAARVGFAPRADAQASGPGGRKRGESRYVDPHTGALLAQPRYEEFFRTTMQLHRWLVMDEVGKQVVGFSTVALVFFCLSGLYLRWPRRWASPRAWLALDWKQKGRNFLWHLHSIVGTWMLLAYLVMALTGLWWSYDWYRAGVDRLAGMPERGEPAKAAGAKERAGGAVNVGDAKVGDAQAGAAGRGEARASDGEPGRDPEAAALDITANWTAFARIVPAWSEATMQWPRDGGGVQFRYLDVDPAHERASNTLELHPATLAVVRHERYADKPLGQRLGGSMFALHRGSFFGLGGVIVFMLASLLMPLFAITGWMLYLQRRRRQRDARDAASALPASTGNGEPVLVAYASQTGTAERIAWQTAADLRAAGLPVAVRSLGALHPLQLAAAKHALFITSTFGDGEAPDTARGFARRMRYATLDLSRLRHAVLTLGDRSYDEFCEFGRQLDQWLHHHGARPLFDRIEVDAGDEGALRHWQHQLGVFSGRTDLPDWRAPEYAAWRLVERELANPGSPGGPCFRIALQPADDALPTWQAGDIAEIGPRNAPAAVATFLAASGYDGDVRVVHRSAKVRLAELLARSRLPDPAVARGMPADAFAATLQPLPHREYSIASLPADGSLQLLVRQMRQPDGSIGLGSGWLTVHAGIGDDIALRIRSNPGFHPPADARGLVLIGNGTGLAGLRSLLKARIAAGHHRNWLLFGERSRAHDLHYREELEAWQASGALAHVDLAFSREQPDKVYVQDRLRANLARLREWMEEGASVYVCGSLHGMAPGVDAVLQEAFGAERVEQWAAEGRYRRDVY